MTAVDHLGDVTTQTSDHLIIEAPTHSTEHPVMIANPLPPLAAKQREPRNSCVQLEVEGMTLHFLSLHTLCCTVTAITDHYNANGMAEMLMEQQRP